jgi:hypothetical protein
MDFREFSFNPDIRVCIYHVGIENLAYHRHTYISDITYCASGRLMLELPECNTSYIMHPGQFIQVPCDMVHRVSHCSPEAERSSYVLVQIGQFSIDFVHDERIVFGQNPRDLGTTMLDYSIGSSRERLMSITQQLTDDRPADLTDSEYVSILAALRTVCRDGIARPPDRDVMLEQLNAVGTRRASPLDAA